MKENELAINKNNGLQPAIDSIRTILESARAHVAREVNSTMLSTYWEIGHCGGTGTKRGIQSQVWKTIAA